MDSEQLEVWMELLLLRHLGYPLGDQICHKFKQVWERWSGNLIFEIIQSFITSVMMQKKPPKN